MTSPASDPRTLLLGQLLCRSGLLSDEQLNHALRTQRSDGGPLGQVLLELGYISDRDLASTLATQFGLVYEGNPDERFQPEIARLVDEPLINRHSAIPLRLEGDKVVVGMVCPDNLTALDDIAARTHRRVMPVVITQQSLARLLVTAFRIQENPAETKEPQQPQVRLQDEQEIARIVHLVSDIITQGLSLGASDIHFEPMADGVRIRYRLDGVLTEAMRMPGNLAAGVVSRIKVLAGLDISEHRLPQDGRFEMNFRGHPYDLRTATLPTLHGEKATIRVLDRSSDIRTPQDLGLPETELRTLLAMSRRTHGMVIVTGPTGSGKTTTLTAMLADLNQTERHIVTIEDPIEYQVPGVTQVQVNTKAGLTFANGLRAFLRHDPDVIMVGEMRDIETVQLAIRAALTGHLVLTTLHTTSAAGTVSRLFDMGVEPYLVAATLSGVVAQRLVRRLCPRCKQPVKLTEAQEAKFWQLEDHEIYEAVGCNYCNNLGYRGRISIYELLLINPEMADLIARPRVTTADIDRLAMQQGMTTLMDYGIGKVAAGETSLSELQRILMAEV